MSIYSETSQISAGGVTADFERHYVVPTSFRPGPGPHIHLLFHLAAVAGDVRVPSGHYAISDRHLAVGGTYETQIIPLATQFGRERAMELVCFNIVGSGRGEAVRAFTGAAWDALRNLYPEKTVLKRAPSFFDNGQKAPPIEYHQTSGVQHPIIRPSMASDGFSREAKTAESGSEPRSRFSSYGDDQVVVAGCLSVGVFHCLSFAAWLKGFWGYE